jgi:pimeloyl-ACP methyl ester carboxylesterase
MRKSLQFGCIASLICLSATLAYEVHASTMTPVAPVVAPALGPLNKLIVIGFMGGNVSADNMVHMEAQLIERLKQDHARTVHAAIFANRHGAIALKTIIDLLDIDRDGHLSDHEKQAARIVIFGHSWGASETVSLSRRLNQLGIPVLLTVQVDSVQKSSENDRRIPPNVLEAVNFYQTEGLLHGRSLIVAADPAKTKVLGNYQSSYRQNPVSCAGYPWYARAFMKQHIQIENDPAVWSQVEAMILARTLTNPIPSKAQK